MWGLLPSTNCTALGLLKLRCIMSCVELQGLSFLSHFSWGTSLPRRSDDLV